MIERSAYTVASIKPFWRWAVAMDERPDLPAIPYYRKTDALAFFDESSVAFPERTTVLLRRRWMPRRVEVCKRAFDETQHPRESA